MRKLVTAVALTLLANTAFAQFDVAKDPYGANWIASNFSGVYSVVEQGLLVRMIYDKESMRFTMGDNTPFLNLVVDSYDLVNKSINVSYDFQGVHGVGTMKKYRDGVSFTLDDGSVMPFQWVRVPTQMDSKTLYCRTADVDMQSRGDHGFHCDDPRSEL